MKKATLALSMIVKNEEKFLEGCLQSVQGLVDKIVVVDTGSTDKTLEIADRYKAEVYSFEWINDFAAARNYALDHTDADWILYLDADERLETKYHEMVRHLINSGLVDAIAVKIRSQVNGPLGTVPHLQTYPRIFRKKPEIRFEFPIHEQIMPSLVRSGFRVVPAEIVIEHLGYAQEEHVIRQKIDRNIEFLEKQIEREPQNAYALYQLGQTYGLREDKKNESTKYLQKAITAAGPDKAIIGMSYLHLALLEFEEKRYEKALEYVEKSLAEAPVQYSGFYFRAELNFLQENYTEAVRDYERVYEVLKLPPVQRKTMLMIEKELEAGLVLRRILEARVFMEEFDRAVLFLHQELHSMGKMDEYWLPLLTILIDKDNHNLIDWKRLAEKIINQASGALRDSVLIHFLKSSKWKQIKSVREFIEGETRDISSLPVEVILLMAEKAYASEDFNEVNALVEHVLLYNPENIAAWVMKANAAIKTGNFDEAIRSYEMVVKLQSDNVQYLKILGGLYAKTGNFEQAQRLMKLINQFTAKQ